MIVENFVHNGVVKFPFPPDIRIGNTGTLADRFIYLKSGGESGRAYTYSRPLILWESLDSELHPDHVEGHMDVRNEIIRSFYNSEK